MTRAVRIAWVVALTCTGAASACPVPAAPPAARLLPAPVVLTSSSPTPCGRIEVDATGARTTAWRRLSPSVPRLAAVFARNPDLGVLRRGGRLGIRSSVGASWWSSRPHPLPTGVAMGPDVAALSTPDGRLWVAARGRAEVPVGRGEIPLGVTTRGVLVTVRYRYGLTDVFVRDRPYRVAVPVVVGAWWAVWNPSLRSADMLGGGLWRTTPSGGVRRLTGLARAGILVDERGVSVAPVARGMLTVRGGRRFAVVDPAGRVRVRVRMRRAAALGEFGGAPTLSPDGRRVAVPVAWLRAGRPSGRVAVLVARLDGGHRLLGVRTVPPARIRAAAPTWTLTARWHGSWVLLTGADGTAVAVDTLTARRVDLSGVARGVMRPGGPPGTGLLEATWGAATPAGARERERQRPIALDVAAGRTGTWVLSQVWRGAVQDGALLQRVDPATGRALRTVRLRLSPTGMRQDRAGRLHVAGRRASGPAVLTVDPQTLRVIVGAAPPGAVLDRVTTAAGRYEARRDGTVRRLHPLTGRELARRRVGAHPHRLAVTGGSVWVLDRRGTLWRLDPVTLRTRATVRVPHGWWGRAVPAPSTRAPCASGAWTCAACPGGWRLSRWPRAGAPCGWWRVRTATRPRCAVSTRAPARCAPAPGAPAVSVPPGSAPRTSS